MVLIAAHAPAMGQTCEDPVTTVVYNHFEQNKDVAFPPQSLAPGDVLEVRIENTCKSAFNYAYTGVPGPPRAPGGTASPCNVQGQSVSVCIRHEVQFGAYLVQIEPTDASRSAVLGDVTKDLDPVTLTIPVIHNPWRLDFTSGFTISDLTDPVFAGKTQTEDSMEVTRIIRDRRAEDDRNLGVAAFTHVTHEGWGGPRRGYLGLAMGLGIDERNEASYYAGPSWLMGDIAAKLGDRAALTAGYQWGSVNRLPAGVSLGDAIMT